MWPMRALPDISKADERFPWALTSLATRSASKALAIKFVSQMFDPVMSFEVVYRFWLWAKNDPWPSKRSRNAYWQSKMKSAFRNPFIMRGASVIARNLAGVWPRLYMRCQVLRGGGKTLRRP